MLQLTFAENAPSEFASAYNRCRQLTRLNSTTFYLSSQLLPQSKRQAIWAIYAWCRRTDELVDGVASASTTLLTLDRWERRLEALFAGQPQDDYDAALADSIERFAIDIHPFRELIEGQRMDLRQNRYETFASLYDYCYKVAGTVGLMSLAVIGAQSTQFNAPWQQDETAASVEKAALALGVANQLVNILRDVGEDARRGRIYLPLEDLARFGYSEQELFQGVVSDRWQQLMQFQIQRAEQFFSIAERGINRLAVDGRFPVWAALMLYRNILNQIKRNQYDVFRHRAIVSLPQKLNILPVAWLRAQAL